MRAHAAVRVLLVCHAACAYVSDIASLAEAWRALAVSRQRPPDGCTGDIPAHNAARSPIVPEPDNCIDRQYALSGDASEPWVVLADDSPQLLVSARPAPDSAATQLLMRHHDVAFPQTLSGYKEGLHPHSDSVYAEGFFVVKMHRNAESARTVRAIAGLPFSPHVFCVFAVYTHKSASVANVLLQPGAPAVHAESWLSLRSLFLRAPERKESAFDLNTMGIVMKSHVISSSSATSSATVPDNSTCQGAYAALVLVRDALRALYHLAIHGLGVSEDFRVAKNLYAVENRFDGTANLILASNKRCSSDHDCPDHCSTDKHSFSDASSFKISHSEDIWRHSDNEAWVFGNDGRTPHVRGVLDVFGNVVPVSSASFNTIAQLAVFLQNHVQAASKALPEVESAALCELAALLRNARHLMLEKPVAHERARLTALRSSNKMTVLLSNILKHRAFSIRENAPVVHPTLTIKAMSPSSAPFPAFPETIPVRIAPPHQVLRHFGTVLHGEAVREKIYEAVPWTAMHAPNASTRIVVFIPLEAVDDGMAVEILGSDIAVVVASAQMRSELVPEGAVVFKTYHSGETTQAIIAAVVFAHRSSAEIDLGRRVVDCMPLTRALALGAGGPELMLGSLYKLTHALALMHEHAGVAHGHVAAETVLLVGSTLTKGNLFGDSSLQRPGVFRATELKKAAPKHSSRMDRDDDCILDVKDRTPALYPREQNVLSNTLTPRFASWAIGSSYDARTDYTAELQHTWVPPERAVSLKASVQPSGDIWSLGVLALRMLGADVTLSLRNTVRASDERPESESSNLTVNMNATPRVCCGKPVLRLNVHASTGVDMPLLNAHADIPADAAWAPAFVAFVHACLAPDPDDRPRAIDLLRHPIMSFAKPIGTAFNVWPRVPVVSQNRVPQSLGSESGESAINSTPLEVAEKCFSQANALVDAQIDGGLLKSTESVLCDLPMFPSRFSTRPFGSSDCVPLTEAIPYWGDCALYMDPERFHAWVSTAPAESAMIGEGANGFVIRAKSRQNTEHPPLALKYVDVTSGPPTSGAVLRDVHCGIEEYRVMADVGAHAHVVRAHGVFVAKSISPSVLHVIRKNPVSDVGGHVAIAMERTSSDIGTALVHTVMHRGREARLLRSGGPPVPLDSQALMSRELLARILRDIVAALSHVHARGVVHLDLKPGNVLVASDTARHECVFCAATGVHDVCNACDAPNRRHFQDSLQSLNTDHVPRSESIEKAPGENWAASAPVIGSLLLKKKRALPSSRALSPESPFLRSPLATPVQDAPQSQRLERDQDSLSALIGNFTPSTMSLGEVSPGSTSNPTPQTPSSTGTPRYSRAAGWLGKRFVLGDFGISARIPPERLSLGQNAIIDAVTTAHMTAPEMIKVDRATGVATCGTAADVWALGIMAAQLVSHGIYYYVAHDAEIRAERTASMSWDSAVLHWLARRFKKGIAPLLSGTEGHPDELYAFVRSCLAMDPKERPTAEQLAGFPLLAPGFLLLDPRTNIVDDCIGSYSKPASPVTPETNSKTEDTPPAVGTRTSTAICTGTDAGRDDVVTRRVVAVLSDIANAPAARGPSILRAYAYAGYIPAHAWYGLPADVPPAAVLATRRGTSIVLDAVSGDRATLLVRALPDAGSHRGAAAAIVYAAGVFARHIPPGLLMKYRRAHVVPCKCSSVYAHAKNKNDETSGDSKEERVSHEPESDDRRYEECALLAVVMSPASLTAADAIKANSLTAAVIAEVALTCTAALDALHSKGIEHGFVNTRNVFVMPARLSLPGLGPGDVECVPGTEPDTLCAAERPVRPTVGPAADRAALADVIDEMLDSMPSGRLKTFLPGISSALRSRDYSPDMPALRTCIDAARLLCGCAK